MAKLHILLIDDDPLWQLAFSAQLSAYGLVECASSAKQARTMLAHTHYDLAFIDLDLEERLIGLEVVALTKKLGVYNVIVSSNETDEIVSNGYHVGCMDYLAKPVSSRALELIFQKFQSGRNQSAIDKILSEKFVTQSPVLADTLEIVKRVNLSQKSILITGESGTGKSHLARLIHEVGQLNADQDALPFVALNCSQFTESMIESELFGHVKGSFTGALKDKKGLIEKASGGTLFLDEVHALSSKAQQKLLTAIETGVIYPVGSEEPKHISFRVICATCEPIEELVAKREFRRDLYYRIKTFVLHIPALRERREDILALFAFELAKRERKMVLSNEVKEALLGYSYPANVREISDMVENWSVAGLGVISLRDLPSQVQKPLGRNSPGFELTSEQLEFLKERGLKNFSEEIKRAAIESILAEAQNQSDAAKILGVSKSMISKELGKLSSGGPYGSTTIQ